MYMYFLQVSRCIHFCHEHMSAIVAAPCNMNCINDILVSRCLQLVDTRNPHETHCVHLFASSGLQICFRTEKLTKSKTNATSLRGLNFHFYPILNFDGNCGF